MCTITVATVSIILSMLHIYTPFSLLLAIPPTVFGWQLCRRLWNWNQFDNNATKAKLIFLFSHKKIRDLCIAGTLLPRYGVTIKTTTRDRVARWGSPGHFVPYFVVTQRKHRCNHCCSAAACFFSRNNSVEETLLLSPVSLLQRKPLQQRSHLSANSQH